MEEKLKTTKIITANDIPNKKIISKIPLEFTPLGKMRRFALNIAQKRLPAAGELSALPVSPI